LGRKTLCERERHIPSCLSAESSIWWRLKIIQENAPLQQQQEEPHF
jgi:hypothetical protein